MKLNQSQKDLYGDILMKHESSMFIDIYNRILQCHQLVNTSLREKELTKEGESVIDQQYLVAVAHEQLFQLLHEGNKLVADFVIESMTVKTNHLSKNRPPL